MYLILGAKEQMNKQMSDITSNNGNGLVNGADYWDYGHVNHLGNGIEDRVSASSGIASANSSSMPWGLPDVGSNSAGGQTFGPQVNLYHTQSTSPASRPDQPDISLDQELRNLRIRNCLSLPSSSSTCKCSELSQQTPSQNNNFSSVSCEIHGNGQGGKAAAKPHTTPSPHLNGLPQISRNDNVNMSPSAICTEPSNSLRHLANCDASQSSTIGSSGTNQQNNENILINSAMNARTTDCLTETTDCASEISVLTATTNTTAGPLLSSRRESTRKSKKGITNLNSKFDSFINKKY